MRAFARRGSIRAVRKAQIGRRVPASAQLLALKGLARSANLSASREWNILVQW
jgi:hypothetical protein